MVSTDPISDMFSRIRNAALVNKTELDVPHSKIKEDIARILVSNGFLQDAKVSQAAGRKFIHIEINNPSQPPNITSIKRLSRPGKRVYVGFQEVPKVKRGRGLVILSTSGGIMTGNDAAKKKIGGELICEVY